MYTIFLTCCGIISRKKRGGYDENENKSNDKIRIHHNR